MPFFPLAGSLWRCLAASACRGALATTSIGYHESDHLSSAKRKCLRRRGGFTPPRGEVNSPLRRLRPLFQKPPKPRLRPAAQAVSCHDEYGPIRPLVVGRAVEQLSETLDLTYTFREGSFSFPIHFPCYEAAWSFSAAGLTTRPSRASGRNPRYYDSHGECKRTSRLGGPKR